MKAFREQGFTLQEMITLTALISVLVGIAIPEFSGLLDRAYADAKKNSLLSDLQTARSHAVKQAKAVVICGSSQGLECDGKWRDGWLVLEQGESKPLQVQRGETVKVSWRGFSSEIVFLPNGTSPTSNGRFDICSRNGRPQGSLIINRQGRVRSEKANQDTLSTGCQTSHP